MAEYPLPRKKPDWVSYKDWRTIQDYKGRGRAYKDDIEKVLYRSYKNAGGTLGYTTWNRQGYPEPTRLVTPRAQAVLDDPTRAAEVERRWSIVGGEDPGGLPPTTPPTTGGAVEDIFTGLGGAEPSARPGEEGGPEIKTQEDGSTGYFHWDPATGQWRWQQLTGPTTPTRPPGRERFEPYGVNPYDDPTTEAVEGQFNPNTGQWEPGRGYITPWQREQLGLEREQAEAQRQWQEQQMGWQREQAQMQQQEQERQYRAQLAAQPMSWLQYAAYTGEQPVVQPWMVPLGQTQVGQPIQGFEGGQAGQQNIQSFTGLPRLTQPSAQLWSRMGPTAQQQYVGYRQARTGIRPEEELFRRQAAAPPGGRTGLRWTR